MAERHEVRADTVKDRISTRGGAAVCGLYKVRSNFWKL